MRAWAGCTAALRVATCSGRVLKLAGQGGVFVCSRAIAASCVMSSVYQNRSGLDNYAAEL